MAEGYSSGLVPLGAPPHQQQYQRTSYTSNPSFSTPGDMYSSGFQAPQGSFQPASGGGGGSVPLVHVDEGLQTQFRARGTGAQNTGLSLATGSGPSSVGINIDAQERDHSRDSHSHSSAHEHATHDRGDEHDSHRGHSHGHGHKKKDRANDHDHSHGGHSHGHGHKDKPPGLQLGKLTSSVMRDLMAHGASRNLFFFGLALCFSAAVQAVYGSWSHNMCLVTLSTHTASQFLTVVNSLITGALQKQSSNSFFSYGYLRFEVMVCFANGLFVILLALFLVFECIERLLNPQPVEHPAGFLLVVFGGVVLNIAGVVVFREVFTHNLRGEARSSSAAPHNKAHQPLLSIPGVSREVTDELYIDIGTACGAVLGQYMGALVLDPLLALFALAFLVREALPLLEESGRVLLQAVPRSVSAGLTTAMRDCALIEGVLEVRRTHFWTQGPGIFVGSITVRVAPDCPDSQRILDQVSSLFSPLITHMTVQIERE